MNKILSGDIVVNASDERHTGIAFANPENPSELVVIFNGIFGRYAQVFDEDGKNDDTYTIVKKLDRARIAWDALDSSIREVLIHTRYDKKISAIKALRALTNLGLTDAKRAIEEFAA